MCVLVEKIKKNTESQMEAWFPYMDYVTNYETLQFIRSVVAGMCIKIQNLMNWFILDQNMFHSLLFNFSPTYQIA